LRKRDDTFGCAERQAVPIDYSRKQLKSLDFRAVPLLLMLKIC